jgi:hypothetical protein
MISILTACGGGRETVPTVAPTRTLPPTSTLISPPTQTPALQGLSVTATATPQAIGRATLPPTYTPTPSPTMLPTRTPTFTPTITWTPSITPTLDPVMLCDEESITARFTATDGATYQPTDRLTLLLQTRIPNSLLYFEAVNRENGELYNELVLHGGFPFIRYDVPAVLAELGGGTFDWTITLNMIEMSGLCEQRGFFYIGTPDETEHETGGTFLDRLTTATPAP